MDLKTYEVLYGLKTKVAGTSGYRLSDRITFTAECNKELSKEEVEELQSALGYSPHGYGGPWGLRKERVDNLYYYVWTCSASCD